MRVNEIFYSLQGEGYYSGTPAIFLRLSGCNLQCSFCDTEHHEAHIMTEAEIVKEMQKYPSKHVVITGGEPTLQLTWDFVNYLHGLGYYVQVETNGTLPVPSNVDWVTCSPKYVPVVHRTVDELKVVYKETGQDLRQYDYIMASYYYLQPCDVKDAARNAEILSECINHIKDNPKWKLSLQTQKILKVQ